jgi:hypothetical protein
MVHSPINSTISGYHWKPVSLEAGITGLQIFRVPEFDTRASFKLECREQCAVVCCVAGNVARELVVICREDDIVTVRGVYEPRPSTAASNTPWAGRFRVRALRVLESARIAVMRIAADSEVPMAVLVLRGELAH